MPIDKAHKATDKQIEAMERHIDKIYREAENGVIQKADAYFKQFDRLDKQKAEQVAKGLLSEEEYLKWRKNKMLYGKRFDNMKQQIAQELATVNETALAYINGELPKTYIANYNAVNEGIQNTVDGYSFELVDKNTVKKIATEGDKSLLPPPSQKTIAKLEKSLAEGKDIRWNTKKINAEVLQGVLQGESMDKIAKRMRNVTDMNKTSAIRNARTMVTGAENAGRMDMLHKATSDGIQVQKEWIAAIDKRTRHWHADLDGELKDIDEPFENDYGKIMFPADPTAHPANVYNCRCSLGYKVLGFRSRIEDNAKPTVRTVEKVNPLTGEVENIELTGAFSGGNMIMSLGEEWCDEANKALESVSNPDVIKAFQRFKDIYEMGRTDYQGAHYMPNTQIVEFNADVVRKGNGYKRPFQNLLHEFAHAIDDFASERGNFSETWGGGKFFDDIRKDALAFKKSVKKETGSADSWSCRRYVADVLEITDSHALGGVSDSLEAFLGSYPLGGGHGSSYWGTGDDKKYKVCTETFAHFSESYLAGDEYQRAMKAIFPNAYDDYLEMINEVGKGV